MKGIEDMKKTLATIILLAAIVAGAAAKDFTQGQKQLRIQLVKALTEEGITPKIDPDGDITFDHDGTTVYAVISDTHEDPYLVSIWAGFTYSDESVYTKKNMEGVIPLVNMYKGIKLFCHDNHYTYRADIYCQDASWMGASCKRLLEVMDYARSGVSRFLSLVPAGTGYYDYAAIERAAYDYRDKGEYDDARFLFNTLADGGYKKAYGLLAILDLEDPKADMASVEANATKALNAGETWAAFLLGKLRYNRGDYAEAMEYFETSADGNDGLSENSLYYMGEMYEKGLGTTADRAKAVECYRRSALRSDKIDSEARLAMARLGEPVESRSEFTEATKAMTMGMTKEQMFGTGEEYELGINNRKMSLPKAYAYIKAAADEGHAEACMKMGEILRSKFYPFGDVEESDKYYKKAFRHYKRRADKNGYACYGLGVIYENGYAGNEADKEQATYYYKKGFIKGDADASLRYGQICLENEEYPEALKAFRNAAGYGRQEAMYELAELYRKGLGTDANKAKAIEWYKACLNADDEISDKARERLKALGE